MEWIALFLIGIGWYFYLKLRRGKYTFWKLVGHNPEEAYRYFKNHSDIWMVVDIDQIKDINKYLRDKHPEYQEKWIGPYRLYVPSLGNVVQVFGRRELYEQEQDKLIEKFTREDKDMP